MIGYQTQSAEILSELMLNLNETIFIPVLTEIFSNMLVISAQQNFECSKSVASRQKKNSPHFPNKITVASFQHKKICQQWRDAGRPRDKTHPMKVNKLESQRKLQQLSREERSSKAIIFHNDLMECFNSNISQIFTILKKARGDNLGMSEIPFIETLSGTYSGRNVLEGFC